MVCPEEKCTALTTCWSYPCNRAQRGRGSDGFRVGWEEGEGRAFSIQGGPHPTPLPHQGTTKPTLPFFMPPSQGLSFLICLVRDGQLVPPHALWISGHSRTPKNDLSHPKSKGPSEED